MDMETAKIATEWGALVLGLIGSGLWSMNKARLAVALLWASSSLLWIVFAVMNGHDGLMLRDAVGFMICAMGVRTYARESRLAKEASRREASSQMEVLRRREEP